MIGRGFDGPAKNFPDIYKISDSIKGIKIPVTLKFLQDPDILPDTPSGVSGGSKLAKITDGAVILMVLVII